MSLLSRLFAPRPDDRAALRPLWTKVVATAREPGWYAKGGVPDSIDGRFAMVALVLAAVLLRMERDGALKPASARLIELFVSDMDGQLRQNGIGDLVVGKHIKRLMAALGGRIETLREGLAGDDIALGERLARNLELGEGGDRAWLTARVRKLAAVLDRADDPALLAGSFGE